MSAIQIVLSLFALFALTRVVLRFRRGGLPFVHLALWVLFWSAVIVAVLQPMTTNVVARLLGVGRGADVVTYLGLVVLFYLLFRMFGKLEDLERQITRVVRAAALKDLDDQLRRVPPPPIPPPPPPPSSPKLKLPPPPKL
jgi:small membrane protein